MDSVMTWEIVHQQGWNESTMLVLLTRFLEEKNLLGAFEGYLNQVAQEENEDA